MKLTSWRLTFAILTLACCSLAWAQEPSGSAKPGEAQSQSEKTQSEKKDERRGTKKAARDLESDRPVTREFTPEEKERIEKQETKDLIYKSINFVILFGLIIYFLAKPATQFFESRTAAIRKGMSDAAAAREAAEERLAEIEKKLANLHQEIAGLRAEAAKEDAVQAERMHQATEAEAAKIRAASESEIDMMTRTARLELKAFVAELAVDLAEERIKTRLTPEVQGHLLQSYVKDLTDVASDASSGRGKN